jgi:hypothetical protein
MAGQIQLTTSGPQEKFFTLDPDYSHFIESFKKHSNFSVQFVDLDPENAADFGKKVRFKIPQNQGDLLKTLSLKLKLPELVTPSACYIESVGHALIEYVDIIIGGKVIQRLTSDYLQIYSEHFVTQTKQYALEQLIGKFPERTAHRRVSDNEIIARNTLGTTEDENFFVDLPFYFYNHSELAIPLCAIKEQEIEVEFKIREKADVVIKTNGDAITLGDLDKQTGIIDFNLCTELVYLDAIERIKIENTDRDYLITQVQQNTFDVGTGVNEGSFKLDFVNPVKELYFVIQRQGTAGDGVSEGNFVTPFDYDNTSATQDGKYTLYENLDYLTLALDGQDVITQETGNVTFLKAVQAAIHHSKTQLIRRFYSYSFALQPEEWYPTGQVNFSLIKEQILKMNLTSCPDYARQIRVYGVNYNILRVSEGTAKTLFNLKY